MRGKNTKNATRRAILRERREKRQKQATKKAQKAQQGVDGKTDKTEDGTTIAPPLPPSPAPATITGTSTTAPVAAKDSKAARRYRHRIREINSSMKAWKDDLRNYKKAEFRTPELEQQLHEVKKQVSDLGAAAAGPE